MNHHIKTVLLLTGMSALFLVVGYSFGGQSGMMMALMMSIGMNFFSYWFSDRIVLAMHQAKQIGPGDPSGAYEMVQDLCMRNKLPMPKVYLIPEWAPNAFATGRSPEHSAVAVTQGLVDLLSPREVRAVLAHELGHVQNRDILISTIVASFASAIMYLAHMAQWFGMMGAGHRDENGRGGVHPLALIVTVILAPLAATLVQMAVSRTREYMADETGARLADDPEGLASALQKISDPHLIKQFQQQDRFAEMGPAFSHLYIVSHFSRNSMLGWFSTHPPVKERIRRLMELTRNY